MRPHANGRYTGPIPPEHITRRYRRLPHWEAPHRIIFITFRLCDSLPGSMVKLLRQQLSWLQSRPPASVNSSGIDPETVFGSSIAKLLDRNYGYCVLRDPAIARLVEAELLSGDGSQYLLGDFVIMPNHVHTLIEPLGDSRLSDLLRRWKGRSARLINQRLNQAGRIWMPEYFDHLVRSYDHLLKYQDYIRRNPVTAGLSPGEFILGCGSANWRQEATWLSAE